MKTKNIISIILSLILFVSVLPASVSAAESQFPLLDVIGLSLNLEDGAEITRYDLAKTAISLGGLSITQTNASSYVDVGEKHWAFSVVNTVTSNGYMGGNADGTFRPEASATVSDATQVLLNLLGYGSFGKMANWTSGDYLSKAQSIGLLKGVNSGGEFTKEVLQRLIVNMLEQPVVTISSIGNDGANFKVDNNTTYLTQRYGYYFKTGVLQAVGKSTIVGSSSVSNGKIKVGGATYNADGRDYSEFLGYEVRIVIDKNETNANVLYAEINNKVSDNELFIPAANIDYYNSFKLNYTNENGKKDVAKIAVNNQMFLNGQETAFNVAYLQPLSGSVKLYDSNGDREYDLIYVTYETVFEVNGAIKDQYIGDLITNTKMHIDGKETIIYDQGSISDISSIKSGNIVIVRPGAITFDGNGVPTFDDALLQKVSVEKSLKTVSGKVNGLGVSSCIIGDKQYSISKYLQKLIAAGNVANMQLNSYVTAYFNEYNEIIFVEIDVETSVQNKKTEYGVLTKLVTNYEAETDLLAKIFTKNGEFKIIKFSSNHIKFNEHKTTLNDIITNEQLFPSGVFKNQLIEYELDEAGKLVKLNTAIDYTDESVTDYIGYDLMNFSKEFSGSSNYRNGFEHLYTFNDNSVLFEIPMNPAQEEKYKVTNGVAYVWNVSYDISLYDTDDGYVVQAGLIDYSASQTSADAVRDLDQNHFYGKINGFIVESTQTVLNADGKERLALIGYTYDNGSSTLDKRTLIAQENDLKDTDTLFHMYEEYRLTKWEDLLPGDVIQYHLDSEGNVERFRVVFMKRDLLNAAGTDVKWKSYGSAASTAHWAVGKVIRVTESGDVIYQVADTKIPTNIRKGTPGKVYIFEGIKVRQGSVDDIRPDEPTVFVSESGTLYEIYIYR